MSKICTEIDCCPDVIFSSAMYYLHIFHNIDYNVKLGEPVTLCIMNMYVMNTMHC